MGEADAAESIDGGLALLAWFGQSPARRQVSCPSAGERKLEITDAPWGVVAAVVPQSAFLFLALTCLLNAAQAGNAVLVRAPSAAAGTAEILSAALPLNTRVLLVQSGGASFVQGFCGAPVPGLLHYFGGSGRIPDLLGATFESGKALIADGEGNAWVYVDESYDAEAAVGLLIEGSTRYGGQTCTSINGAIIHPSHYRHVAARLSEEFRRLPRVKLGDDDAASHCYRLASEAGSGVVAGGGPDGAFVYPMLVVEPNMQSKLVREGAFGPTLWVVPGIPQDFHAHWLYNRFPLCAAVLGREIDADAWTTLANVARLVINGDPSLEDPLEPWGGYPATGNNPVSDWYSKYRRAVQIDRP